MLDPRNFIEALTQEPFVMLRVGHHDLDQIVVVAGDEMGLYHFGHAGQGAADLFQHLVVVLVEGEFNEDGVG